jgi:hypothetical protein
MVFKVGFFRCCRRNIEFPDPTSLAEVVKEVEKLRCGVPP